MGSRSYNNTEDTNGALMMVRIIMKNVMSLAAEAEVGALFNNFQEAEPLRVTLKEIGHKHPATPLQADNYIADWISNSRVK